MTEPPASEAWPSRAGNTALLLVGGAVGAVALTLAQVPAGTLIGAVLGGAAANRLIARTGGARDGPRRAVTGPIRVLGMVLLGSAAGVQLEWSTIESLGRVALPLAASIVALLVADVGLAAVLTRRYHVDPLTALLACAPGGVSEIAVTAQDLGARLGVVLAIHLVRVLVVVLVVLPLAVYLLGHRG